MRRPKPPKIKRKRRNSKGLSARWLIFHPVYYNPILWVGLIVALIITFCYKNLKETWKEFVSIVKDLAWR